MTHPRVGLGVFIFRSRISNQIAWGLRQNSLGHGTWSLAGGHLELNETFEQCAIRETREETGLELEDVRFLTAIETLMDYEEKQYHYVTVFMMGFARNGEDGKEPELKLMEPDKSGGWCWRSMQEAMALDASPDSDWTLFQPVKNFIAHRPAACALLDTPEELYRQAL